MSQIQEEQVKAYLYPEDNKEFLVQNLERVRAQTQLIADASDTVNIPYMVVKEYLQ